MILNQQTFFPNFFKAPPHAFYIFWRHRPIRLIKINPETHTFCHRAKCVHVTSYRLATFFIKGSNSKLFNVAFARESQFLFNCNFNRQSVAIPTCFTKYVLSFHRLITRKYIFKNACFNVVSSGHSICSRRTFVKSPRCALRS